MNQETFNIFKLREQYIEGSITPEEVMLGIIEKAKKYKEKNIWIIEPSEEFIFPYLLKLKENKIDDLPLYGIPFAIKDNIDLAGFPTTAACPKYSYTPKNSATVVGRLIKAGAIPVGKTNMDQFATGLVGTRSPYGEVHNAIHDELISGGSSSGSAVAVALGLAAFSLGTDTAGSGRVPGSLNNLVGFKPTVGAWPSKGVVPACASLDCVTVFSGTVEEASLVDKVARGLDKKDKWSKSVIRKENKTPDTIFIPAKEPEFYGPYEENYRKAWYESIDKLRTLGVKVIEEDTSFYQEAALLLYGGPCVAERWADLGEFVTNNPDDIFPVTKTILESGNRPDYSAEYLYQVQHKLREYKRISDNLLEDAVLIFPTCAGTYTRDMVRENPIETNSDMGKYTNHCNLLDMCAMQVPTAIMDDDMPFGVTIFAKAEDENLVFGLAEML